MKDLRNIRDSIDEIDCQIVELYEKRMELAAQVAEYKISTGKAVFDPERELSKLNALAGMAHSDFTSHGVRELFEHMMAMSRKKQYQLLTEYGKSAPTGFYEIQEPDFTDASPACVPASLDASGQYFPSGCSPHVCGSWEEACALLKKRDVNCLFLPVQDPESGYVSANYNLIAEYGFYIIEEFYTSPEPKDRYLLISSKRCSLRGADKLTICFEAPDECGTLYHLMSHLTYNGLNMNRVESIVISKDPLDYRFFMDISGNLNESPIKNAILGMGGEARNFKILGNYR